MGANKGAPASVEVEGGPQLRKAFSRLGDRCNDLSAIHKGIAAEVVDAARSIAPHVTGNLAKRTRGGGTKKGAYVFAGGRLVPYAGPIHFGWHARNIEPQPFLYDALDDRRDAVVDKYRDGIGDLVRTFDREAP